MPRFKIGDVVYHKHGIFGGVGIIESIEKYGERIVYVRLSSMMPCYEAYSENLIKASDPEVIMKAIL